jgi:glycosyltransferase involved in cell wall biosynthesis
MLLTSDREGTPNVILEAMAFGLPVVATRVGGLPAVVFDGETGYLVGREDEAGLADAVLDLVQNREKRIAFGKRGRIFVQRNHTLPKLTTSLRQLYNTVLPPAWVPGRSKAGSDLSNLYGSAP